MAITNINYQALDECINEMNLLAFKLKDILKEFEAKTNLVFHTPYYQSNSAINYENNCKAIKDNLANAYDMLVIYKDKLFTASSNYSKTDDNLKEFNLDND